MRANESLGFLSQEEQTMSRRASAADLIAFMDSQRVTIGPPLRPDGSGWLIAFDSSRGAFLVSAWVAGPVMKLDSEQCSTLDEALQHIRRYEHLLPL